MKLVKSLTNALPILRQSALGSIATAQEWLPTEGALSNAYPGKAYSPYAQRVFPKRPLWGNRSGRVIGMLLASANRFNPLNEGCNSRLVHSGVCARIARKMLRFFMPWLQGRTILPSECSNLCEPN